MAPGWREHGAYRTDGLLQKPRAAGHSVRGRVHFVLPMRVQGAVLRTVIPLVQCTDVPAVRLCQAIL
jgi:hypothetical protein